MTKRPSGSGSIYRLQNGNWRALATIDGQRISYTAKTQKECRDWLEITTSQVKQGLTLASARTSFDLVLDNWFSIKENKLRGATQQQYSQMIGKYINRVWEKSRPKTLRQPDPDFTAHCRSRALSAHDRDSAYRLRWLPESPHRLGLVAQNWADLVEVPRPMKKDADLERDPDQTFLSASLIQFSGAWLSRPG